ncbi:MAG: thioredoxin [Phycisphaerales bacterium]|jgi:thioredoxin 1
MSSANFLHFNDSNFEAEVIGSGTTVLVDFSAKWCAPCRQLEPTIAAIADEFAGKAKVGKVDIEESRNVAMKYGIAALPTLILFKGGMPVKKWTGLQKKDVLVGAMSEAAGG